MQQVFSPLHAWSIQPVIYGVWQKSKSQILIQKLKEILTSLLVTEGPVFKDYRDERIKLDFLEIIHFSPSIPF